MLSGHVFGFHEGSETNELLLEDPVADIDDEEAKLSGEVLHTASFKEFARSHVQCDTIIWVLISLPLVLAWGVGIIMLLYLPIRRYVLLKEISSCKLYVTANEIVYKVKRPFFLPFLGLTKIEKHIPLNLVIDIILEQGFLQTIYGIHTFRIESIAYGKAAPVDELQFQGVSDPVHLRKVIITEAAKRIREVGSWKPRQHLRGDYIPTNIRPLPEVPGPRKLQPHGGEVTSSSRDLPFRAGYAVSNELLLHKLEEVEQSVKKIESLVGGSETCSDC